MADLLVVVDDTCAAVERYALNTEISCTSLRHQFEYLHSSIHIGRSLLSHGTGVLKYTGVQPYLVLIRRSRLVPCL